MTINFKVKIRMAIYGWVNEYYVQHFRAAYGSAEGEHNIYCEDLEAYWQMRRYCEKWLSDGT